jgi:hypothetical protein
MSTWLQQQVDLQARSNVKGNPSVLQHIKMASQLWFCSLDADVLRKQSMESLQNNKSEGQKNV